jgi:hypothetical protein
VKYQGNNPLKNTKKLTEGQKCKSGHDKGKGTYWVGVNEEGKGG